MDPFSLDHIFLSLFSRCSALQRARPRASPQACAASPSAPSLLRFLSRLRCQMDRPRVSLRSLPSLELSKNRCALLCTLPSQLSKHACPVTATRDCREVWGLEPQTYGLQAAALATELYPQAVQPRHARNSCGALRA